MDVMDPSNAQQHQETLESMLMSTKAQQDQKKPRPQPEHALKCPRCDSTNTKFCYYNNYSLTQPRYFCKACRRYWTKGGTLRNVPVGGGCRKNKRTSSKMRHSQDQTMSSHPSPLSGLGYDSSDLTLAFARLQKQPGEMEFNGQDLTMMTNQGGLFGNFAEGGSGFQNVYYGVGSGNFGNMGTGLENLNHGQNEELGVLGYEQDHGTRDSTPVKQEYCHGVDQQRVLWGFPWQLGNNENLGGEFENNATAGREMWNGIGATWHGLLNSPLM